MLALGIGVLGNRLFRFGEDFTGKAGIPQRRRKRMEFSNRRFALIDYEYLCRHIRACRDTQYVQRCHESVEAD